MTHFAVPTVNLMIIKDDQLLMSRRANTGWMDGSLVIPGGHVEENETPTYAVIREAKEELGIKIEPEDLKFVCVAVRHQMPEEHIAFEYKIDGSKLDIKNMEPEKCSELVWVSINHLPQDVIPDFRVIIEKALIDSNAYVEVGWQSH